MKLLFGDVLSFARHYKGEPFHALLCDAPYHLTSITERFGKEGSAEAQYGDDGAFQRASKGFMGKSWDGGDISFRPETWEALGNLLYPGAFGMTFGGSRTAHRIAVAIEDAGFIIHPMIGWVYGSGFPKATRIDKQVDRNAPRQGMFEKFAQHFAEQRKKKGLSQKEIAVNFPSKTGGLTGCVWNWENGANVPTLEQWKILQPLLDLSDEYLPLIERIEAEREIVGKDGRGEIKENMFFDPGERGKETGKSIGYGEWDITAPATPLAQSWEGHRYGLQALKPALEPIIVFQKPYEGRPIDSITKTGAGALNIDGGRIGVSESDRKINLAKANKKATTNRIIKGFGNTTFESGDWGMAKGRWPSNFVLTHSPDCQENLCVDGCPVKLLDGQSGISKSVARPPRQCKNPQGVTFMIDKPTGQEHTDSGGASRFFHQSHYDPFFYQAKSSQSERNAGLKERCTHPTIKPIRLTRHLATLLLPPEEYAPRRLLIPFAGTGSEMIGAFQAGWECVIGVELEKEYVDIGRARLKYWLEQGVQLELM